MKLYCRKELSALLRGTTFLFLLLELSLFIQNKKLDSHKNACKNKYLVMLQYFFKILKY